MKICFSHALFLRRCLDADKIGQLKFSLLFFWSNNASSDDVGLPPYFTGPFGDQDGEQVFVQRVVPDTNQVFVRLASNGDRSAIFSNIALLFLLPRRFT